MKTKILVAALVCLSLGAVAQQSDSGQKPSSKTSTVTALRDAASDMATGKKMAHDDWQTPAAAGSNNAQPGNGSNGNAGSSPATMVRESPSKASLGVRESPSKASLRESPTKSNAVSAGDVNGDGTPDKAAAIPSNASGQNAAINNSHSNIKSPRDLATGQATGKPQHQHISLRQTSEDGPKK